MRVGPRRRVSSQRRSVGSAVSTGCRSPRSARGVCVHDALPGPCLRWCSIKPSCLDGPVMRLAPAAYSYAAPGAKPVDISLMLPPSGPRLRSVMRDDDPGAAMKKRRGRVRSVVGKRVPGQPLLPGTTVTVAVASAQA
jgi:hypothetical protein